MINSIQEIVFILIYFIYNILLDNDIYIYGDILQLLQ